VNPILISAAGLCPYPAPALAAGCPIGAHPRALRDLSARMFAALRQSLPLGGRGTSCRQARVPKAGIKFPQIAAAMQPPQ